MIRRSVPFRVLAYLLQTFVTAVICSHPAWSQDRTDENLFGSWGGSRSTLSEHGIEVESILTLDLASNLSGGLERGSKFLGNYDFTLAIDGEKAGLWHDFRGFVYVLGNFGEAPSSLVGDLQVTDNIEADETIKLYEAWIEQSFFEARASVLFGLHDYNSEFYVLEYSSALLNSSFGIGADVSQVGPSIFSTTSLAVRLAVVPTPETYLRLAAYDGVPGAPNNSRGTHIRFDDGDGVFTAVEGGYAGEEGADYAKAALGLWFSSATFEDFSGETRDRNNGMYVIAEKRIYSEPEDVTQGLGAFVQFGAPRESRNQLGEYLGAGVSYTGLIPERNEDVLSLGIARARNSSRFTAATEGALATETAVEVSYHAVLAPYLAVTPDIQWIQNPGAEAGIDDALVLTVRLEIAM